MIKTAIWIPPSLCGCQFQITADWLDGDIVEGNSYRHPKSGTITDIQLISVCPAHKAQSLITPDYSPFFEMQEPDEKTLRGYLAIKSPGIKPKIRQVRGYLTYPIDNPTTAHNLYTFFSTHGGQKHSYPCGCSAHQYVDETGVPIYTPNHPLNTNQCAFHQGDTVDMAQAKIDHDSYTASQAAIDIAPVTEPPIGITVN